MRGEKSAARGVGWSACFVWRDPQSGHVRPGRPTLDPLSDPESDPGTKRAHMSA